MNQCKYHGDLPYKVKGCKTCGEPPVVGSANGSLSGFGSEILIAAWEAHAAQCDQTADQFDAVTKHLVCSFREKARAYRKCIEDLRRQMGHESKRQPTENDEPTHRR
jgi:hypothetical protein